MPIFEYTCCDCAHEFEELVATPDQCPPCPKCGSDNVTKLMSACAVKSDSAGAAMPDLPPMPSGGCSGGG